MPCFIAPPNDSCWRGLYDVGQSDTNSDFSLQKLWTRREMMHDFVDICLAAACFGIRIVSAVFLLHATLVISAVFQFKNIPFFFFFKYCMPQNDIIPLQEWLEEMREVEEVQEQNLSERYPHLGSVHFFFTSSYR